MHYSYQSYRKNITALNQRKFILRVHIEGTNANNKEISEEATLIIYGKTAVTLAEKFRIEILKAFPKSYVNELCPVNDCYFLEQHIKKKLNHWRKQQIFSLFNTDILPPLYTPNTGFFYLFHTFSCIENQ